MNFAETTAYELRVALEQMGVGGHAAAALVAETAQARHQWRVKTACEVALRRRRGGAV